MCVLMECGHVRLRCAVYMHLMYVCGNVWACYAVEAHIVYVCASACMYA